MAETPEEKKKSKIGKTNKDDYDYIPVCKGIENKLANNSSLKMLEIRYLVLNRNFINAIFASLATNDSLQILTLTHNSLNLAI